MGFHISGHRLILSDQLPDLHPLLIQKGQRSAGDQQRPQHPHPGQNAARLPPERRTPLHRKSSCCDGLSIVKWKRTIHADFGLTSKEGSVSLFSTLSTEKAVMDSLFSIIRVKKATSFTVRNAPFPSNRSPFTCRSMINADGGSEASNALIASSHCSRS